MVRIEGWEIKFSEYLKNAKSFSFEWGRNDCVLYAVKAAEVITGENTYKEYLGYSNEVEARKIIEDNGGFESLISKHFGYAHSNILKARRGDLVLVRMPELCLGIVDDSGQRISCVSEKGYAILPLKKAWRIWSYG